MAGEGGRGDNQRGRRAPSSSSRRLAKLHKKLRTTRHPAEIFFGLNREKKRFFFLYFGFWSYKPKMFFPTSSSCRLNVVGTACFTRQRRLAFPLPVACKPTKPTSSQVPLPGASCRLVSWRCCALICDVRHAPWHAGGQCSGQCSGQCRGEWPCLF